jgi:hypothetical protein
VCKGVGIAVLVIALTAALSWAVMALWNGLMPELFGLHTLRFWQAAGILILSKLLFGGYHHGHGHAFHHRRHLIERWESMTPEEKEKFRKGFRGRFCCHTPKDSNPGSDQG